MAKTTKKRNPTVARGAVIERHLIQRYLTRHLKRKTAHEDSYPHSWRIFATELSVWLDQQPLRTKKQGGIGR